MAYLAYYLVWLYVMWNITAESVDIIVMWNAITGVLVASSQLNGTLV